MIGILGAMDEEVRLIGELLADAAATQAGGRQYTRGRYNDTDVVLSISGFGKVAAAATLTTMLDRFDPEAILFTGVAGGLDPSIRRRDVVVADELVQHDFDGTPILPRFVIPSLQLDRIPADPDWTDHIAAAAEAATANASVHRGLVLSGDQFISTEPARSALRSLFPDALAVEMEGAAVAQVCAERKVPFAVVRAISDSADDDAGTDFLDFIEHEAAPLLAEIVAATLGD